MHKLQLVLALIITVRALATEAPADNQGAKIGALVQAIDMAPDWTDNRYASLAEFAANTSPLISVITDISNEEESTVRVLEARLAAKHPMPEFPRTSNHSTHTEPLDKNIWNPILDRIKAHDTALAKIYLLNRIYFSVPNRNWIKHSEPFFGTPLGNDANHDGTFSMLWPLVVKAKNWQIASPFFSWGNSTYDFLGEFDYFKMTFGLRNKPLLQGSLNI
jgi:hypothetical protein